ncbi:MAG TPA: hypothetical protein VNW68_05240 [Candidatus Limnocylindria bacterium]|nr:hypothetical protein [Candidatus Limnocylindria bacterium]
MGINRPALAAALALAVTACTQSTGPVAPGPTGTPATPPSAAPVTAPPATAAPAGTHPPAATEAPQTPAPATHPPTAGVACETPEQPDEAFAWQQLISRAGDFTLSYPPDWEDIGGLVNFDVGTLLDAATLAEAGIDPSGTLQADSVRAPGGVPNLTIFRFSGVETQAGDVLQRQIDRLEAVPEVVAVFADLPDVCLDGTIATGLELVFEREGTPFYQQSLFTVRDGVAYHLQWLDERTFGQPTDILVSIVESWRWTGGAGAGAGTFLSAGMALATPAPGEAPDRSAFASSFPPDSAEPWLIYELEPGTETEVNFRLLQDGEPVGESGPFHWTSETTWGWYGPLSATGGGLDPGAYAVEVTLASGDDSH